MTYYEGNISVNYALTTEGQYMQLITTPKGIVIMATPDVDKFLKRLLQSEVDREERIEKKAIYLMKVQQFWSNRCRAENIRGQFNIEHYTKVIQAKIKANQSNIIIPKASKWSKLKMWLKNQK